MSHAVQALQGTLTNPKPNPGFPWPSIQKISLYEGSIADVDPHLHAPDLATCIEVHISSCMSDFFQV